MAKASAKGGFANLPAPDQKRQLLLLTTSTAADPPPCRFRPGHICALSTWVQHDSRQANN